MPSKYTPEQEAEFGVGSKRRGRGPRVKEQPEKPTVPAEELTGDALIRALVNEVGELRASVEVINEDFARGNDDFRMAEVLRQDAWKPAAETQAKLHAEIQQVAAAIREQTQLNRDSLAVLAICDRLTANQARELRKIASRYLAETQAKPASKPMPLWLLITLWLALPIVAFLALFGTYALFR